MIIFLYGQDTYRMRQKLKEIVSQHKKTHQSGLNLIFFQGSDFKFSEFKQAVRQTPMFGEKRLLILQNVFNNQDFKEKFAKNYKSFLALKLSSRINTKGRPVLDQREASGTDRIILFYEEGEVSKKDKFLNFLKTKAKSQNFELLQGKKLKDWAKAKITESESKIEAKALDKLLESTGNDLWALSNEIKKLASFKQGQEISLKDVELLTKPKAETAIFKTIDAISQRNKRKALLLVHQHLEKGDHPLYLLSMISFQFRNILIVKDLIEKNKPYYYILKATRLHPFVLKKSYQQAGKLTLAELKKIYQKIFQVDLNIKTGRINPETALDLLIAEI